MQINLEDIYVRGLLSADETIYSKRKNEKPLTEEKILKTKFPSVLQTEYAKDVIMSMITGCISEYHEQLRKKLLESDIDIGELCYKDGTLLKIISSDSSNQ